MRGGRRSYGGKRTFPSPLNRHRHQARKPRSAIEIRRLDSACLAIAVVAGPGRDKTLHSLPGQTCCLLPLLATKSRTASTLLIRRQQVLRVAANHHREGDMKLMLGRPDEAELVLAEQNGGAWQPNPNLMKDMTTFLQGSNPDQFEMWVEEPE